MSSYGYGSPSQPSVPSSPPPSTPRTPAPRLPQPTTPTAPAAPAAPQTGVAPTQVSSTGTQQVNISLRQYPDGEPYHPNLPGAYAPANSGGLPQGQGCYNCGFLRANPGSTGIGGYCTRWNAPIRLNHWCAAWKSIGSSSPSNQSNVVESSVSERNVLLEFKMKDKNGNFIMYDKNTVVFYQGNLYEVLRRKTYGKLPTDSDYFRNITADVTVIDAGEF